MSNMLLLFVYPLNAGGLMSLLALIQYSQSGNLFLNSEIGLNEHD